MYIKFLPNEYVLRYRKGKMIESGAGLSFYYFDKSTAAAVIPTSVMDTDFIFEEKTVDFQNVTVQGQMTYRVTDYERIASQMDFSVNLKTKTYHNEPQKKLSKRIVNIAEVMVRTEIGGVTLTEAVKAGSGLADTIYDKLREVEEIKRLGVEITGFSILKCGANVDTVRALEARTREEILKESDDALYERRNASIEQERKVKENELNTEISVEEKKKQIRETEIATERMMMEKDIELKKLRSESEIDQKRLKIESDLELDKLQTAAEAEREQIKIDAQIEIEKKRKELADLRLENAKKDADAEAYRLRGIMEAYNTLSPEVLVALATIDMEPEKLIAGAFEKLAANSGKIGTLNITPDFLESIKKAV